MANSEHVRKLKEGVQAWNEWREYNRETIPDLQGADLSHADLEDSILIHANLQGSDLSYANLQNASLENAYLKEVSLIRANLHRADLIQANLEEANVTGVKFDRSSRQRCFQGIRAATCYGSQRFKSFAQDQDFIEELRSSGRSGKWMFWCWWISTNCGRSFLAAALWCLCVAVFFGSLFYWMGAQHFDVGVLKFNFLTMIYYSVITFTTLGFGDVKPTTPEGLIVVMVEVILGYIMLGCLISIFANKVARRA